MGWAIVGIIVAFLFYKLVIRFFIDMRKENKLAINSLTPEVKEMINNKDAEKLARLIVHLNIDGRIFETGQIMKAVDSKGVTFATKVDKYRNQIREELGIAPLRKF